MCFLMFAALQPATGLRAIAKIHSEGAVPKPVRTFEEAGRVGRGSKHQIFAVFFGSNRHLFNLCTAFWDQSPEILGTWTLWRMNGEQVSRPRQAWTNQNPLDLCTKPNSEQLCGTLQKEGSGRHKSTLRSQRAKIQHHSRTCKARLRPVC